MGALTARSRAISLMLAALFCTSCHGWFAFSVRNDTDELHYVRVTANRTGQIYVHQVDPRTSGAASFGPIDPGPPEGDVYTVELLDATCSPLAEWGMPSTGGYLKISGTPEFFPDYLGGEFTRL